MAIEGQGDSLSWLQKGRGDSLLCLQFTKGMHLINMHSILGIIHWYKNYFRCHLSKVKLLQQIFIYIESIQNKEANSEIITPQIGPDVENSKHFT